MGGPRPINLHQLPPARRLRAGWQRGHCQADLQRDGETSCQGDWTHAADLAVVGVFAFLLHLTRHWWED